MYDKILSDLQQRFPDPLLTPEQVAEVIKTDSKTQANMRSSGTFPIPIRKIGKKVLVSVYDLAKFINGDFDQCNGNGIDTKANVSAIKGKKKSNYDWLTFTELVLAEIDINRANDEKALLDSINLATKSKYFKRI